MPVVVLCGDDRFVYNFMIAAQRANMVDRKEYLYIRLARMGSNIASPWNTDLEAMNAFYCMIQVISRQALVYDTGNIGKPWSMIQVILASFGP